MSDLVFGGLGEIPVASNTTSYSAATTGDFKLGFTVPTGATVAWSTPGSPGITHPRSRGAAPTDWDELDAVNASTTLGIHILGIVVNGATAGNLTFQWAQAVSDATATSVKTNSFLTARRVA